MDYDKLVKIFLKIRDRRGEIKRSFEEEDNRLKEQASIIEAQLLKFLIDNKLTTSNTANGTFYRQEDLKPSAGDWQVVYDWIREHNAFDMLERRLKKDFIKSYMEENEGALPPGVNVYRESVIRVRRPS